MGVSAFRVVEVIQSSYPCLSGLKIYSSLFRYGSIQWLVVIMKKSVGHCRITTVEFTKFVPKTFVMNHANLDEHQRSSMTVVPLL